MSGANGFLSAFIGDKPFIKTDKIREKEGTLLDFFPAKITRALTNNGRSFVLFMGSLKSKGVWRWEQWMMLMMMHCYSALSDYVY